MREIESTKARNIPRAIALADGAAAHYADANSVLPLQEAHGGSDEGIDDLQKAIDGKMVHLL